MSCVTRGYRSRRSHVTRAWTARPCASTSSKGLQAPRYGPRAPRPQLLDPYRSYLRERVEEYPRIRGTRLLREIRQLGYPGCYSQLTAYLREVRPAPDRGFEHRFETAPGEQAQVDFAQFKTEFTEEPSRIRVVWLFSLVLGYCRWLTGSSSTGSTWPVCCAATCGRSRNSAGCPKKTGMRRLL